MKKHLVATIIYVLILFSLPTAWTMFFDWLAESSSNPFFMHFVGIIPWAAIIVGLGCFYIDKEEEKRKSQYRERQRMRH